MRDHSHRRIELRLPVRCARCGTLFIPTRSDARYCCGRCKVAGWRASRPRDWACVWWVDDCGREPRAVWSYHRTEERAQRAAPTTGPFTVVNIARKPAVALPNIDELLFGTSRPAFGKPSREMGGAL